jgi:hypothetical protein
MAMFALATARTGAQIGIGRETMDATLKFDVLRDARGDTYDALLALDGFVVGLGEVTSRRLGGADWEDRVLATVLQARAKDPAIFTEVEAELARIDPALESRKASGLGGVGDRFRDAAQNVWGPRCLPVALEGITRRVPDDPAWRTDVYLAMLEGVPDALSVAPVAALLATTDSEEVRFAAARTLSRLPKDAALAAREDLTARQDGLAGALTFFDSELAR